MRFILSKLSLDKIGIVLSFICLIHCLLLPFIILALPMLARYYLAHPLFHWLLAIMILPLGVLAFYRGYIHHHRKIVFTLGIPGLLLISVVPTFFHTSLNAYSEPLLMTIGSCMLIAAHWMNRRSCACEMHQGSY